MFESAEPIRLDQLHLPEFEAHSLSVYVIRADLVHPEISGNKWFKLKYNLLKAKEQGARTVLSFGGAYSNHIHALAYASKQLGLESVAVIRGEPVDNPTLVDAKSWGMALNFVDRASYRMKSDSQWLDQKMKELRADFLIPEGGSNRLAVLGVSELAKEVRTCLPELNYLLTATGTGGTIAGLIAGSNPDVVIEGYPVLKNGSFLKQEIQNLLSGFDVTNDSWSLDLEAHFGGYGKVNAEHKEKWLDLEQRAGMLMDPIYTSKLFRRFIERVELGYYPKGSTIALLHSGGIQGRRGVLPE